jgi:hypothetical protein
MCARRTKEDKTPAIVVSLPQAPPPFPSRSARNEARTAATTEREKREGGYSQALFRPTILGTNPPAYK